LLQAVARQPARGSPAPWSLRLRDQHSWFRGALVFGEPDQSDLSAGCGLSITSHVAGGGSEGLVGCGDSRPLRCSRVEATPSIPIIRWVLVMAVPGRVRACSGVRASIPESLRPRWPDHAPIAPSGGCGLCILSRVADSRSKRREIMSRPYPLRRPMACLFRKARIAPPADVRRRRESAPAARRRSAGGFVKAWPRIRRNDGYPSPLPLPLPLPLTLAYVTSPKSSERPDPVALRLRDRRRAVIRFRFARCTRPDRDRVRIMDLLGSSLGRRFLSRRS
jgi:hypothetical protein